MLRIMERLHCHDHQRPPGPCRDAKNVRRLRVKSSRQSQQDVAERVLVKRLFHLAKFADISYRASRIASLDARVRRLWRGREL